MTDITYTVLTDKDKLDIVNNHIRNKEYTAYNDEIAHMEEACAAVPNQGALDTITLRIADTAAQIAVLQAEAAKLNTPVVVTTDRSNA